MKILLDTQIVIWWTSNSSKISKSTQDLIRDSAIEKYLSYASLWEMAIKIRIGKLILLPSLSTYIDTNIKRNGIQLLAIEEKAIYATQNLELYHQDTFDRLIIAQAITHNLPVITSDSDWKKYPIKILT